MKIAYLLDSTSSLNKEDALANLDNVYYLQLDLMIDKEVYATSSVNDILQDSLLDKINHAKEVKSMMPTMAQIGTLLDKVASDGYDVLVTCLVGSGISNLQNLVYQEGMNRKLTIIQLDSKGVGPVMIEAIKKFMAEISSGQSLVQIQSKVQHMINVSSSYCVIDNLSHLVKGGSISNVDAILKNILDVKQIVMCDTSLGGKIKMLPSARSINKALSMMLDDALSNINTNEYHFYIGHYGDITLAKLCEDLLLEKAGPVDYSHVPLNDTIGVHTGSHCVCFFSVRK